MPIWFLIRFATFRCCTGCIDFASEGGSGRRRPSDGWRDITRNQHRSSSTTDFYSGFYCEVSILFGADPWWPSPNDFRHWHRFPPLLLSGGSVFLLSMNPSLLLFFFFFFFFFFFLLLFNNKKENLVDIVLNIRTFFLHVSISRRYHRWIWIYSNRLNLNLIFQKLVKNSL